jgi:hypothetical protein
VNTSALHTPTVCGHDHLVEFYETDEFLVDTVSKFVLPSLRDGDAAIIVATAAHRHEFERALEAAGVDIELAVREDRYIALDARDVLSRFMVDGHPGASLFAQTVRPIMERAAAGGRSLRVYGEMVALLWDEGDVPSALALEDLWNDLARERTFALLCAYPMSSFDDEGSAAAFKRICDQHTNVIPSEPYSLLPDDAERSRMVARLQQENVALQAEMLRLKVQHEVLAELAYVDSCSDACPSDTSI